MIVDAIRYSSLASPPTTPDRFLGGQVTGSARICSVFLAANSYGVDLHPPFDMEVTWRGASDFEVKIDDAEIRNYVWRKELEALIGIGSSFWCSKIQGVFQLDVGWIFRTPPGVKTLATGPINEPSPAFHVHTGILDSDWFHIPATTNLQFYRIGETALVKKERPIARLMVIGSFEEGRQIELRCSEISEHPIVTKEWRRYIREVYGEHFGPEMKRAHRGVYVSWRAKAEGINR